MSEVLTVRVPKPLKEAIERIIENDMHISVGDLVRDALREKIKRDYTRIYREVMEVKK